MPKESKYLSELHEIMAQNGGMLRPEDVVSFAKNPTTALHSAFTWEDDEAAHNWRLWQARQVIIRVSAVYPDTEPETKYRAFVSLKADRYNDRGYRAMVDVLADGNLREVMLAEAMMDMQAFMQKYDTLKELAGVFAEMQKVVKRRGRPRKRREVQATA
jgi:hypothetical protein